MATVHEAVATFERNIEVQTGRPVGEWSALARGAGFTRHGEIVSWLKGAHGLSHSHANHVAKRATLELAPRAGDDPAAHLFEGGREALRPLYDRLVAAASALGPDVEIAPKKANASVRRRKQFALLQPSTRTRLDLGLILKDRAADDRLEPSGSFNAMFTHRVRLAALSDIDAELLAWLREAYDDAK